MGSLQIYNRDWIVHYCGYLLEVIILLQALLIIIMQLVIVPLTTLRTIFVVKGEIRTASILGGLEAMIYVIV